MELANLEKAYKLLPDLREAGRKLHIARELETLQLPASIGRELADYEPPSNIGAAFRTIKAALIELHEKELAVLEGALRALGVEP